MYSALHLVIVYVARLESIVNLKISTFKEMTAKEMISIFLAICCSCANGFCLVYCEMGTNGRSGGWMRIANVDMKNNQLLCPPDWSTVSLAERGRLGHKPTSGGSRL